MQNYKESVAYDFELFAPKKNKVIELPETKQKAKTAARPKARLSAKSAFSVVAVSALILFMIFFQLYGELQTSEITDQITTVKGEIETLKSEEVRLNMEIETKVSYQNIEKLAAEMGMQKKNKSQINYVSLCDEDVAVVLSDKSGIKAAADDLF